MSTAAPYLRDARVVLDCRRYRGGVGVMQNLLLRCLHDLEPPGTWVLWGDPTTLAPLAWPSAEISPCTDDPLDWMGQRGGWSRPSGDLFCAVHQIRPCFLRQPVLQWFHDTIPLHSARTWGHRLVKTLFLRIVAATSRRIITPSEYSARCLRDELNVRSERITVLPYPVDPARQARVADRRRAAEIPFVLCAAGRATPHKNLPRLFDAFSASRFAASGGRLMVLSGGESSSAQTAGHPRVTTLGYLPDDAVDDLFATAAAVVCPSLDEGFGFPVWDARCFGLPVACSTGGSLPEVAGPDAVMFDPLDVGAITRAIDAVTLHGCGCGPVPSTPTPREYAEAFVASVEQALAPRRRR